jgi:hypothetical protein
MRLTKQVAACLGALLLTALVGAAGRTGRTFESRRSLGERRPAALQTLSSLSRMLTKL